MANMMKCPACGQHTPADLGYCQHCQSRLLPADEDQPLTPGQAPTRKNTSDLESVLPQWLQDVRETARQASQQDEVKPGQEPPITPSALPSSDLLSGLQLQDNEEDEVPDWLANITGQTPKTRTPQANSEVRWVEFEGSKDFTQPVPQAEPELPPWMSDQAANEKDELTDWLRATDAAEQTSQPSQPYSFETPSASSNEETPDWLRSMVTDGDAVFSDSGNAPSEEKFSSDETPDWLRGLEEPSSADASSSVRAFSGATDWLKQLDDESAAPQTDFQPQASDTPDWLKAMSAESVAPQPTGEESDWPKSIEAGTPESEQEWLKSFQSMAEESSAVELSTPDQSPVEDASDLPDWLKAAAPQESLFDEAPAPTPASLSSPETPDWLNTLQSTPGPDSAFSEKPAESAASTSTGSDSLFADLPDWLSVVDETVAPSESMPAPITNTDAIAPGELPTWVQAMRPVEAGLPQALNPLSTDKTLETRGALAGLQGVLPAAPNYAPTSKPKAHSIRLQASEEQLSHATLLEQILSAETSPVAIGSFAATGTSRALRWTLAVLLFVSLTLVLAMRITVFPLPDSVNVPLEAGGAVSIIQSIPENMPILVIFDYEPARAGEVESVIVPIFDQLLMKHARLTFISTTETGAVLADRLAVKGYLSGHEKLEYVNLGYLPAAQLGIRAFADNPSAIAPYAFIQNQMFDYTPVTAWDKPALQGVTSLPQFAAILLATDDADSARIWIEQTQSARGNPSIPLIVASSAQAAPMLQPYFASGQINGMVSGLYGGALFERRNLDKPGTAIAAWDAYSTGILLAIILILGGGVLNLIFGLRDRAAARETK